jgi:hypothetical protein
MWHLDQNLAQAHTQKLCWTAIFSSREATHRILIIAYFPIGRKTTDFPYATEAIPLKISLPANFRTQMVKAPASQSLYDPTNRLISKEQFQYALWLKDLHCV